MATSLYSCAATSQPRHVSAQLPPAGFNSNISMDCRPPWLTTYNAQAPLFRCASDSPCETSASPIAPGHAGSPQDLSGSSVTAILVNVFFARSYSAMPAPTASLRPMLMNWVAIKYLPSGVSSRSSGDRVPQRTSISPWTPHVARGGAVG